VFEGKVMGNVYGPVEYQDGSWRIRTDKEIC